MGDGWLAEISLWTVAQVPIVSTRSNSVPINKAKKIREKEGIRNASALNGYMIDYLHLLAAIIKNKS